MSKVNDDSSYNGNLKDCKPIEFKKFQEVSLQIYKATSYYKDMHIWSSAQIFIINQLSNMGVEYQFNKCIPLFQSMPNQLMQTLICT